MSSIKTYVTDATAHERNSPQAMKAYVTNATTPEQHSHYEDKEVTSQQERNTPLQKSKRSVDDPHNE